MDKIKNTPSSGHPFPLLASGSAIVPHQLNSPESPPGFWWPL